MEADRPTDERSLLLDRPPLEPRRKPNDSLPKAQVILLCYARMVEAIAFFYIFPFVNQMVQDEGHLDEEDVGFYSGLLESLFSLTQMCVTIPWSRAADRFGRKPVLVVSLFGVSVATGTLQPSTQISSSTYKDRIVRNQQDCVADVSVSLSCWCFCRHYRHHTNHAYGVVHYS